MAKRLESDTQVSNANGFHPSSPSWCNDSPPNSMYDETEQERYINKNSTPSLKMTLCCLWGSSDAPFVLSL